GITTATSEVLSVFGIAGLKEDEQGQPRLQHRRITPHWGELFTRTHTKKNDQEEWVDQRAEDTSQLFEKELKWLEEECAALIVVPPISHDEVWAKVAGGCKRGLVYGRCKVPQCSKPTLHNVENVTSTSDEADVLEQVTLLNQELT
ncbi:hypothetical protein PIB30_072092, partial [Stylosanthes scabra]|nr:hypothetical protein [Stylosanthes scabra]